MANEDYPSVDTVQMASHQAEEGNFVDALISASAGGNQDGSYNGKVVLTVDDVVVWTSWRFFSAGSAFIAEVPIKINDTGKHSICAYVDNIYKD